jgi:hypothetical protein
MAFFMVLPNISHAQFGVVRRAINRQIDHKIDSSIDKSAQDERDNQAKEESEQNKTGEGADKYKPAPRNKSVGLFGGKIDIKYNDNYDFTGRIYMIMETHDKKDVIKSDFYTYFNSNSLNAGIELQTVDPKDPKTIISTVFLFDHENRAFMSLITSNMGTISAIPSDSALASQVKTKGENTKQPVVTKTGNSRMIAGYKCDEYKVVEPDKDGYSLVWMTKDFKVKADTRYWGKSGMPTYYNYPGFEGAVMLAMEEYDKNNDLATKMETKEVSENFKHSISTVGYTFTKVNFGQAKSGKK